MRLKTCCGDAHLRWLPLSGEVRGRGGRLLGVGGGPEDDEVMENAHLFMSGKRGRWERLVGFFNENEARMIALV